MQIDKEIQLFLTQKGGKREMHTKISRTRINAYLPLHVM